ncbi:MAG: helix-turn-helix domain-containing protein [Pseudomonadota bacterium]
MPSICAKNSPAKPRIAIIAFAKTKLLDVAGPLQVFSDAQTASGQPAYDIELVSETGGLLDTDTICQIKTIAFRDTTPERWDTVLVSGGSSAYEAMQSPTLLDFVSAASLTCRRLGSICLGAFVLAAGGHLAGRNVTTHWDGCAELATRFPDIKVKDDAIFVEDDGIWTSAGVTAGIDMALEMVKQDLGATETLRIAKSLVLPAHRSGSQRQFNPSLATLASGKSTRFADLALSVASNLRQRHSVSNMAERVGMSERNFSRQFSIHMGVSPAQYVERLRVDHAASLLLRQEMTLVAVQEDAGFANAEQMRRAFQRCLGISPSDYAERFAT